MGTRVALRGVLVVTAALALTSVAGASPAGKVASGAASSTVAAAAGPTGYAVVYSPNIDLPPGQQASGIVSCPAGTVATGGGASNPFSLIGVSVNGSYPSADGSAWNVRMNNATGGDTFFNVQVICAKQRPGHYYVQGTAFSGTPGGVYPGILSCRLNFRVIGGGESLDSTSTLDAISGLNAENQRRFNVWSANVSGSNAGFTGYVICGKLTGESFIRSSPVPAPAGTLSPASVTCGLNPKTGGQEYPVSGGVLTHNGPLDPRLNLNELIANGPEVDVWENNGTPTGTLLKAYAICAGK